jgi:hypothetical protein
MAARRIVPPAWMSAAYDAIGAHSEARACLQRAFQERHMLLVHLRGWMTALGGLDRVRDLLDRYDL